MNDTLHSLLEENAILKSEAVRRERLFEIANRIAEDKDRLIADLREECRVLREHLSPTHKS